MSCIIAIVRAVDSGEDVNEVEAAGNTPLHNAAFEGWLLGAELLLSLGARIDASNNAGDRAWHSARNMGHDDMMEMLEQVCLTVLMSSLAPCCADMVVDPQNNITNVLQNGASTKQGKVLVADHIPKVKVRHLPSSSSTM